jgi:hypothetical protein
MPTTGSSLVRLTRIMSPDKAIELLGASKILLLGPGFEALDL